MVVTYKLFTNNKIESNDKIINSGLHNFRMYGNEMILIQTLLKQEDAIHVSFGKTIIFYNTWLSIHLLQL